VEMKLRRFWDVRWGRCRACHRPLEHCSRDPCESMEARYLSGDLPKLRRLWDTHKGRCVACHRPLDRCAHDPCWARRSVEQTPLHLWDVEPGACGSCTRPLNRCAHDPCWARRAALPAPWDPDSGECDSSDWGPISVW
jgi:hypothetical protein